MDIVMPIYCLISYPLNWALLRFVVLPWLHQHHHAFDEASGMFLPMILSPVSLPLVLVIIVAATVGGWWYELMKAIF